MTASEKPIVVLGAGAVGSILAGYFAKIGQTLLLIENNSERFTELQQAGLNITGDETISVRPTRLLKSLAELKNYQPQALFICTKTWSLQSLLPQLASVLHPSSLVISFQNGIGLEDELAKFFPSTHVARGIVNYASTLCPKSGAVTMQWFNPPNYLGPLHAEKAMRRKSTEAVNKTGLASIARIPYQVLISMFKTGIGPDPLQRRC